MFNDWNNSFVLFDWTSEWQLTCTNVKKQLSLTFLNRMSVFDSRCWLLWSVTPLLSDVHIYSARKLSILSYRQVQQCWLMISQEVERRFFFAIQHQNDYSLLYAKWFSHRLSDYLRDCTTMKSTTSKIISTDNIEYPILSVIFLWMFDFLLPMDERWPCHDVWYPYKSNA